MPLNTPMYSHSRKLYSLVVCLMILASSCMPGMAQEGRVTALCENAMNVLVTESGVLPVLNENRRVLEGENNEFLTFFDDEGEKSMWYRLIIDADCKISFNIFPTSPVTGYSFFVYKLYGKSEFCEQIIDRKIEPVRSNLYRRSMGIEGIGLSENYTGSYSDSIFALDRNLLYYTAYHPHLDAKANEIYYINIYRVRGDDCGHLMEFQACGNSTDFRTINLSCFDPVNMPSIPIAVNEQMQQRAMVRLEEIRDIERAVAQRAIKEKKDEPKQTHLLRFAVVDSTNQKRIDADIVVKQISTGKEVYVSSRPNQGFSVSLLEDENYRFSYSAIGYEREAFTIAINDRIETDFMIGPLQKGDKFELKNIYFQPNTYLIRQESEEALNNLVQFLRSSETVSIEIQGHTNGKANISKNRRNPDAFHGDEKKLSKLRAEEIKSHLVQHGIDKSRIKTKGMGDKNMLYPRPINSWEADKNKRVEVYLR